MGMKIEVYYAELRNGEFTTGQTHLREVAMKCLRDEFGDLVAMGVMSNHKGVRRVYDEDQIKCKEILKRSVKDEAAMLNCGIAAMKEVSND